MKESIKEVLARIGWHLNADARRELRESVQDLLSVHTLPDLDLHYIPWATAALRPGAVRALLNEIVIHQRTRMLEFGAGLSTLYVADLFRSQKSGHIVSVENDKEWVEIVRDYLVRLEVPKKHYKVVYSNLKKTEIEGATNEWYDLDNVSSEIVGEEGFDMVLVDGPPANSEVTKNARYPALPFAEDYLQSDFAVFLDDVGQGEEVAQKWMNEFELTESSAAGMGVFRPPDTQATWDIV